MFNLTMNAIPLATAWEGGFKPVAWLDTVADPPVWTIGEGLTKLRTDNGGWRDVTPDDEIDRDESEFQVHIYFREQIEPVLASTFEGVDLQPHQRDALASMVYNMGPPTTFPKTTHLIKTSAPIFDILDEWVDGEWNNALGLYRRRLTEALVFGFGWSWQNAKAATENANWSTGWRTLAGIDEPETDQEIFEELEIPRMKREKGADPTPETPITMDDAQFLSAEAAGYQGTYAEFMSHRTVVTARNAIEAPKVDTKQPPKPIEDSETGRGIAKKVSGKDDAWIGAAIGGASTIAGTASGISKDVSAITKNTQTAIGGATLHQLMIVGLIIGGVLLLYGLWKMYRGEQIAKEGRAKATQLKV